MQSSVWQKLHMLVAGRCRIISLHSTVRDKGSYEQKDYCDCKRRPGLSLFLCVCVCHCCDYYIYKACIGCHPTTLEAAFLTAARAKGR